MIGSLLSNRTGRTVGADTVAHRLKLRTSCVLFRRIGPRGWKVREGYAEATAGGSDTDGRGMLETRRAARDILSP